MLRTPIMIYGFVSLSQSDKCSWLKLQASFQTRS